jgi:NAD(P)H-dependent FMN reductase
MIRSPAVRPGNNLDRNAFAKLSGRSIEDPLLALKLNIVIGSPRPGRVGPVIAQWLKEAAEEHGKLAVELVDLADFDLPLLDEAARPATRQYSNLPTKRWSASVGSADAFLFVTPEYDYFAPAALVNAVQVLLHEWLYKSAGVLSYAGVSGGLRLAQVPCASC